jgi:hypothetical protein
MMDHLQEDMASLSEETEHFDYPSERMWMTTSMDPNRSPEIDKLISALAKAQGAISAPERNKTVKVTPRSGGASYSFKYATLNGIIEAIRKPFSDNGLWFTQVLTFQGPDKSHQGYYWVTTTIWHESGQYIRSEVPLIVNDVNNNQQFGSALTYMKRYALSAICGIAAEEDDDGNIADGNEIKVVSEKTVGQGYIENVLSKPAPPKPVGTISTSLIEVPLLPDESASDWMTWGQNFIAAARTMPDMKHMLALEKSNAMPLKNMEIQVPKMFSNLMIGLIKVKRELEKTNA